MPSARCLAYIVGLLVPWSVGSTTTALDPVAIKEVSNAVGLIKQAFLLPKCKKPGKKCDTDDQCCGDTICKKGKCKGDLLDFSIDFNFTGEGATKEYKKIFKKAKKRWEKIIKYVGCPSPGSPSLTIDVTLAPIDGVGGTLGFAGWTRAYYCNGKLLPYEGATTLDSDDLGPFGDSLEEIIIHEIGHIIGIGTTWDLGGYDPNFVDGPGCTSCSTRGPNKSGAGKLFGEYCPLARNEYEKLAGEDLPEDPLMIETELGGSGTLCGHWSETTFGDELMTGFINSNADNPLSMITVAVLADLGYVVKEKADKYDLPSANRHKDSVSHLIDLGDDIMRGHEQTIYDVDGNELMKLMDGRRVL